MLTTDAGGQTETIKQGRTGLRCHTLADYCYGVQMALDGAFDRAYIRERAVRRYDMYEVAKQYEPVFKTINDVHNGAGGWHSKSSQLASLLATAS